MDQSLTHPFYSSVATYGSGGGYYRGVPPRSCTLSSTCRVRTVDGVVARPRADCELPRSLVRRRGRRHCPGSQADTLGSVLMSALCSAQDADRASKKRRVSYVVHPAGPQMPAARRGHNMGDKL